LPQHRGVGAARGGDPARAGDGGPGRARGRGPARAGGPPAMGSRSGASVQRVEDDRLVRGHGAYLDDLGHDALVAAFVRSPFAHARILDIDVSAALEVDGLVAIYTYEDLPGRSADPLPLLIPHPPPPHVRTPFPLAKDEVNHVGEAVAMVIARDRYLAEDAADRIDVSYEPPPPVGGRG